VPAIKLDNENIGGHLTPLQSYSRVSFQMTLSDLDWLSEILNHTKHRTVSLRQLSFLFSLDGVRLNHCTPTFFREISGSLCCLSFPDFFVRPADFPKAQYTAESSARLSSTQLAARLICVEFFVVFWARLVCD